VVTAAAGVVTAAVAATAVVATAVVATAVVADITDPVSKVRCRRIAPCPEA
jgi:hypothetical protein